eukprot:gb/GECH01009305.1/.p1 GENE.gb/GECH01009305.1/~~gb/GECH01009305.1/.p1  ORF type:complete len:204 (+),score=33.32 gb/GECH01009305.1/:1-612(+)
MVKKHIEQKLACFGSGGVGKSALIVRFIQGVFVQQYDPTLEDSYRKETTVDGRDIVMDILDTAGQEEFFTLRDQYIRSSDGFCIVYSVISKQSFDEVTEYIEQIYRTKNIDTTERLPIVLMGNKSDLESQRAVPTETGQQIADRYGIPFFETSAKTSTNVEEAFFSISRQITALAPKRMLVFKLKIFFLYILCNIISIILINI